MIKLFRVILVLKYLFYCLWQIIQGDEVEKKVKAKSIKQGKNSLFFRKPIFLLVVILIIFIWWVCNSVEGKDVDSWLFLSFQFSADKFR